MAAQQADNNAKLPLLKKILQRTTGSENLLVY